MSSRNSRRRRNRNNQNSDLTSFAREHNQFASTSASTKSSRSNQVLSESRLATLIKDPKNAPQVALFSQQQKGVNGGYKRVIKYLSSLMTFDHTIFPAFNNPLEAVKNAESIKEEWSNMAIFVDRLNPKFNLPLITERILTNGVTYMYKIEDSAGISYQELPVGFCRVSYMEDGVYRYEVDVTKLSDATMYDYPAEIQKAYTDSKAGKKDKLAEGKFYQVSNKGTAFTIDADVLINAGLALPTLANALVDTVRVDNAKAGMESIDDLDNSKIVHSEIETNKDGRPVMDLPTVKAYHEAVKKALPEGSVAITNPFKTSVMSMNGTGRDGKFALLDKAIDQLYISTGVSAQLFADDNSSSQALERSIQVDSQWLYSSLLPLFTNYYNYELSQVSSKGVVWKAKFLPISHFDKYEANKVYKDQLTYGGSRLEYLASSGLSPLEVANMLSFEQQVLNIDEVMVAKQNSHTMSGNEASQKESNQDNPSPNEEEEAEAGRPPSENPSDTTVRIKDSE
nr:MAG TPA: Portal protein [Caudoviricetes sp.]